MWHAGAYRPSPCCAVGDCTCLGEIGLRSRVWFAYLLIRRNTIGHGSGVRMFDLAALYINAASAQTFGEYVIHSDRRERGGARLVFAQRTGEPHRINAMRERALLAESPSCTAKPCTENRAG
jgi:hypothetical protein